MCQTGVDEGWTLYNKMKDYTRMVSWMTKKRNSIHFIHSFDSYCLCSFEWVDIWSHAYFCSWPMIAYYRLPLQYENNTRKLVNWSFHSLSFSLSRFSRAYNKILIHIGQSMLISTKTMHCAIPIQIYLFFRPISIHLDCNVLLNFVVEIVYQ
jgi:hypothetical protein